MSDRLPLEVFLTGSGALNGSRTLEDKYLSAQLSAVEMVRKGCTAACDLFVEYPVPSTEGVDAVARAYRDVGMRAVIAPMMADHTLYQAYLPRARRSAVRGAARDRAPRGHRALDCSDEFLVGCRDLAREYAVGLQTHLAESAAQAAIARQRYGTSLTAHFGQTRGPRRTLQRGLWIEQGGKFWMNVVNDLRQRRQTRSSSTCLSTQKSGYFQGSRFEPAGKRPFRHEAILLAVRWRG